MDRQTESEWFATCYCCLHQGMQKKDTFCCSYCDDLILPPEEYDDER